MSRRSWLRIGRFAPLVSFEAKLRFAYSDRKRFQAPLKRAIPLAFNGPTLKGNNNGRAENSRRTGLFKNAFPVDPSEYGCSQ